MTHSAPAPFDALSPDVVFEAAESIGLEPSGRLFALNSYENRVYQLGDDHGALWVLKFYRPARWSDAQIDEEHAFTHELAAAELPVAAPIERDGATVLKLFGAEVFTAYTVTAKGPVFMSLLERTFGKDITTRTLATVEKCSLA